ncbi:MAG: membrane dipeptidase [Gammaproteobacteria bacterium]|nr:membrane dipeptidase [Gammaproteobacteria bacterium]
MNKLSQGKPFVLAVILVLAGTLSSCSEPNTEQAEPSLPADTQLSLLERARAIHESALVLDAHADIEILDNPSRYVGEDGLSQVAPAKMQAGGVDAVVMSAAVGPGPRNAEGYAAARQTADEEIAAVVALANDAANNVVIPRTADELVAAHAAGKSALILGFQNALILGTEVSVLDELYAAGVRVFALTHMGHNDFADSSRPLYIAELAAHEPTAEHGGLSELGVAAIERINALGGIVDITQLSRQAALQVLELSNAPVIASHSNVQALSDVSRNLSDEEIDRIGEIGGVIHVAPFRGYLFDSSDDALVQNIRSARRSAGVVEDYLYPFELYWEIDDPDAQAAFLGAISELLGPGSLDDMLNHIDYIADRIGADHVGIGTDFNHGSGIVGFKDASEALNVTVGLLERGYSEEDIEKIWGGNFIRVFREAERLGSL